MQIIKGKTSIVFEISLIKRSNTFIVLKERMAIAGR